MNNSYLGLIRQAQGGFDMDHHVQLFVENINAPELGGYGVDHVAVAEGLGCKAIRVTDPKDAQAAFATARAVPARLTIPSCSGISTLLVIVAGSGVNTSRGQSTASAGMPR